MISGNMIFKGSYLQELYNRILDLLEVYNSLDRKQYCLPRIHLTPDTEISIGLEENFEDSVQVILDNSELEYFSFTFEELNDLSNRTFITRLQDVSDIVLKTRRDGTSSELLTFKSKINFYQQELIKLNAQLSIK